MDDIKGRRPDTYKQKVRTEYRLACDNGMAAIEGLARAPKLKAAAEGLVDGSVGVDDLTFREKSELVKRGVLVKYERMVSRIDTASMPTAVPFELTSKQSIALEMIERQFETGKETVLLHGVTSSGKTEIYLNLIKKCVESGGQALMLVPENGLTQHLYDRLKQYLGGRLGVYHTQCPQAERVETYVHQLGDGPYDVVLGTKAAVFLPFRRLRLVIVDEEHDVNYKQTEQLPYYNARDVALYLAHQMGAKAVLGSATPSVESYGNHKSGKYGYVALNERYGGARLPQIQVVDMADERHKKHLTGHFSRLLVQQITTALAGGHQVILFQDRQGYSPYVQCARCGYVPKCPHCGVTLTYSKKRGDLHCGYCGYTQPFVATCAKCGSVTIEPRGLGVEQLEEETRGLFPEARVALITRDNVFKTLEDFEAHKVDILIGNRSIIKGIDYSNVSVLGVMNVDNLLNHPDFRSHERAYQVMMQAAGRTGRRFSDGHLVVQTWMADNPFITELKEVNAVSFYEEQLSERQFFGYPPFKRLIHITIRHADLLACLKAAEYLTKGLREMADVEVSDVVEPRVSWAAGMNIRELLIKLQTSAGAAVKHDIMSRLAILRRTKGYERGVYTVDVDPI